MSLGMSLKYALKTIFSNKMRTLLTMLGIIIGIGSIITIMSIGSGGQAEINSQFESMGVGRITISASISQDTTDKDLLKIRDYNTLKTNPDLKYIAGVYSSSGEVKLLDKSETKRATLTGIYGQYSEINNQTLMFGRHITDNDNDLATKVAVVYNTTAVNVFGKSDRSVIGEKISIPTYRGVQRYTVVGVVENENAELETQYGDNYPETIFLPMVTVQRLFGADQISQIITVASDTDRINEVATALTDALDRLHGTTGNYYAQNIMQIMEQINQITGLFTAFISAVAGISLLVGGIGVMNIMLVTVTERTREIGIRKSIGAKRRDIRTQFLIEAVILTGFGGAIGLALGYAGGRIAGSFVGVEALISVQSVVMAVAISSAIGIIFGVYPANKAAKLDPIEALRYD
jgi:putative ABC transport system permease protein